MYNRSHVLKTRTLWNFSTTSSRAADPLILDNGDKNLQCTECGETLALVHQSPHRGPASHREEESGSRVPESSGCYGSAFSDPPLFRILWQCFHFTNVVRMLPNPGSMCHFGDIISRPSLGIWTWHYYGTTLKTCNSFFPL